MYMPVGQSVATAGYVPSIVTPNPPSVIDNAGAIRLTQLAVTGPGAAIISNTVSTRQSPNNERTSPRASQFLAQLLAQSESLPAPNAPPAATPNEVARSEQLSLGLPPAEVTREPSAPANAPERRKNVLGKATNAYNAANARNLALFGKAEIFANL
jgi:hypothetical protein